MPVQTQEKAGGWEVKGNVSTLWDAPIANDNQEDAEADNLR